MTALYNEIDGFCANWLENQIEAGLIAPGVVDRRSIEDLEPEYLRRFTQVHLFAGIGGWSHALRGAGWPDERPVITFSCPCQPFSAAGKGAGFADERHLWPATWHLIRILGPENCFGEQVASKDGLAWLDLVSDDVESESYTIGALDLCATGFGAPEIRQRLYFGLESPHSLRRTGSRHRLADAHDSEWRTEGAGRNFRDRTPAGREQSDRDVGSSGADGRLVDSFDPRLERHAGDEFYTVRRAQPPGPTPTTSRTSGAWRDAEWLYCRDGFWRPVEPASFPMAHGDQQTMPLLRAYGNCIVIPQAQEFISAYLDEEAAVRESVAQGLGGL